MFAASTRHERNLLKWILNDKIGCCYFFFCVGSGEATIETGDNKAHEKKNEQKRKGLQS